jgi:hypothetical protein
MKINLAWLCHTGISGASLSSEELGAIDQRARRSHSRLKRGSPYAGSVETTDNSAHYSSGPAWVKFRYRSRLIRLVIRT